MDTDPSGWTRRPSDQVPTNAGELQLCYVSLGPLALSLLALAGLPGGALERFALGACRLGVGDQLADLLERSQLLDTAAPFIHDRTHPYSELRIERLRTPETTVEA
jgi:hypothetical protein